MDNWIAVFDKLEAKDGKFSVLGNHDYGDYMDWKNPAEKVKNFQDVKDIHQKIGFDLLLDEHRYLEKDGQKIALLGVENWGKGFNQAGDLQKASKDIKKEDFKILMSHDPSFWDTATTGLKFRVGSSGVLQNMYINNGRACIKRPEDILM